jgi:hypothetical protein
MNLDEIIKNIQTVASELYPGEPEVAKLCEALITWERGKISKATTQYKEPYRKILEGFAKKMMEE